jgi:hypothetical protein
MCAPGSTILAGETVLDCNLFSEKTAKESTGMMASVQKSVETASEKLAHLWQGDDEAEECDECGSMVSTW